MSCMAKSSLPLVLQLSSLYSSNYHESWKQDKEIYSMGIFRLITTRLSSAVGIHLATNGLDVSTTGTL